MYEIHNYFCWFDQSFTVSSRQCVFIVDPSLDMFQILCVLVNVFWCVWAVFTVNIKKGEENPGVTQSVCSHMLMNVYFYRFGLKQRRIRPNRSFINAAGRKKRQDREVCLCVLVISYLFVKFWMSACAGSVIALHQLTFVANCVIYLYDAWLLFCI